MNPNPKPTQDECYDAMAMIDLLSINCAMRGTYTKQHPNLIKLMDWIEGEFDLHPEEIRKTK